MRGVSGSFSVWPRSFLTRVVHSGTLCLVKPTPSLPRVELNQHTLQGAYIISWPKRLYTLGVLSPLVDFTLNVQVGFRPQVTTYHYLCAYLRNIYA